MANDFDVGPGGSVFTKDIERGKRVASQIETGMMLVNDLDRAVADLPFGGVKTPGYGPELGDMGIAQLVDKTLVRTSAGKAPAKEVKAEHNSKKSVGETA